MRANDAINQGDAIISQPITLTSAKPDRASAIPLMDIIRLIRVAALCQSAEAIFGRVYASTESAIMLPTETIAIKTGMVLIDKYTKLLLAYIPLISALTASSYFIKCSRLAGTSV